MKQKRVRNIAITRKPNNMSDEEIRHWFLFDIFMFANQTCETMRFINTKVTFPRTWWNRRGHDRMVVLFKTTYICNQCLSPQKL